MSQVAKLFMNGRSQAVRLPSAFRFNTNEVFIRKDPQTGEVILSSRPQTWDTFFAVLNQAKLPADFLDETERHQPSQSRDPFQDASE